MVRGGGSSREAGGREGEGEGGGMEGEGGRRRGMEAGRGREGGRGGGRWKLTESMLIVHEYNTPGSQVYFPDTHMHQL